MTSRHCSLQGFSLVLLLFAGLTPAAFGQGLDAVRAEYTKYEYRIPVRDGTKLFTAVYVPKDLSQRYPILLVRTPYSASPYGVDRFRSDLGPSPLFGKAGYIFAYQDVRGRWMSEGTFVNVRPHIPVKKGPQDIDESSDTYDTIDWLVRHVPGNSGKVGMWGISYPGFYTSTGIIEAHPALKAASPQAPVADWFIGDDWHHNGALFLIHTFNYYSNFGRPRPQPIRKSSLPRFDHETPDGYAFFLRLGPLSNANARYFKDDVAFWNEVLQHGTYDDFWKARNLRPHLKGIKPAVMTVGGWFDAEDLFGALETYRCVEAGNPGITNILVMGPWSHGGWTGTGDALGPVRFQAKTGVFFRENIELPFFEYHLKGKGEFKHPEAWVFEMGTNQWRKHDAWPPRNARPKYLYFQAGGQLSPQVPPSGKAAEMCDEYISDPARPVPFQDRIAAVMSPDYMTGDQRFASRRPDVLVYETGPLEEDLTIAGPIKANLFVSTSGTDADWVVKLVDVYPDDYPDPEPNPTGIQMGGYQQMVRGDVMRGKFRNSFETPEPFEPGQLTRVQFTLPDVYHTFRTGHRLMVQVQSSWFPLVDRNPQTFVDIAQAKEADFRKATQRVYRSQDRPSHVTLNVLP
jgi:putative CocE/NonD family hydrolase